MRRSTVSIIIAVAVAAITGCAPSYSGGARPVDPVMIDDGWLRAAPTPVVLQQADSDCGLAALAMIGGRWGKQWSVAELAEHIPVTAEGVKLGALRDVARDRGLNAYAISGTTKDLEHELTAHRPVLIGLVLPFDKRHARAHFEVAIAMNPHDGTVITLDPATGQWMRRPAKALDSEWKAAHYAALVVVGPTKELADAQP
jgi:ABC-type bacteriocin/lantibiotic exporter with double-glycine peptidase domain